MKLMAISITYERRFYIISTSDDYKSDRDISEKLNMDLDVYRKILKWHNAIEINDYIHYFWCEEDCLSCINGDELLPYIVMNKLIK